MPDGGIYLIKSGKAIDEPGQMRLIRNDPKFNEQWPRAVVPYERIYGVDQPASLAPLGNDGRLSPALPEGTPYGTRGHGEPLQTRVVSWRACAGRSSHGDVSWWTRRQRLSGTGSVQHGRERRVAQLGQPRSRCRPVLERRHPRGADSRDGADDASGVVHRAASSSAMQTSSCGFSARFRCVNSPATGSRPIPTAIPTRVSWRRFRPTRPSPSRRSIGTAWC